MQRMEVGLNVSALVFKQKKNLPDETKLDDLLKDKNFGPVSIDLRIKYFKGDLNGRMQPGVEDDVAPYASLLLSNIPQKGDRCFPADPTAPCLEMYAQHLKGFKPKESSKKNTLMTDPRQHVGGVELVSGTDTPVIHALIDGQLFGPYYKVRISPVEHGGARVTFPIQTFFPVEI